MRRKPLQARVRTMCVVVPVRIAGEIRSGRAHAVAGVQVNPFVLDSVPQAPHKDVVTPGVAPVHGQLAAIGQQDIGKFRELIALVDINNLVGSKLLVHT